MSSFNRQDYHYLYRLGCSLYRNYTNAAYVRKVAVRLMAMSECVIGKQHGWPDVAKRYRHLNTYGGLMFKLAMLYLGALIVFGVAIIIYALVTYG